MFFWKITNQTSPFPLLCPVEHWVTQDGQRWSSKGHFSLFIRTGQSPHLSCFAVLLNTDIFLLGCISLVQTHDFSVMTISQMVSSMSEVFGEKMTKSRCLTTSPSSRGCDVVITAHGHVFSITDSKQVQECFMNKGLKVKSKNPTVVLFYVLPLHYKEVENS